MTREIGYLEALNEALLAEMARDETIVLIGENIRGGFRPEAMGIGEAFGLDRIIDMPISEAAMTGIQPARRWPAAARWCISKSPA